LLLIPAPRGVNLSKVFYDEIAVFDAFFSLAKDPETL
jgi:hypothetical protein